MAQVPLTVLKFGSSVLRTPADLPEAVHEIYREWRAGRRVVAVVSALGDTTDRLLAEAEKSQPPPAGHELARLLATGEAAAVQLLALALQRAGIPAYALAPEQNGLRTAGPPLDARPVSLDASGLLRLLAARPVLVLPGFAGTDAVSGETTVLGRGGSDLSALFIAQVLHAQGCRLLKDVDGLYERDPAAAGPPPRRYLRLRYADALRLDGGIVQHKALRFAAEQRLRFQVGSCGGDRATEIGTAETRTETPQPATTAPLRVALLGLGTVGAGVQSELQRQRERFAVVGAAVRDLRKPRAATLTNLALTDSTDSLLDQDYDVLVDLTGSSESSRWLRRALQEGRDAVTAGKEVVAREGAALQRLARTHGGRLLCSASVGGALPALETVRQLARRGPIRSFDGILSGTCNFLLDRLHDGIELEDAVAEAQKQGLAEADPSADLSGRDAAWKLAILAEAAFGTPLAPELIQREGIAHLRPADLAAVAASGGVLKLVASACREPDGRLHAEVAPLWLHPEHPLAQATGAENRLLITPEHGPPELWCATGAGRWPTTESVLADLLDLWRLRRGAAVLEATPAEAAA
ncbi:MAG: homoserine dehydrogenase [Planctomycetota bacterium]|nr:MAG: homoserine dehydrogenase [Planctomycetota bacterium]